MKESAPKSPASLLITIGVVLVHLLVIGLIVWGCNSAENKKAEKNSARTEAAENPGDNSEKQEERPTPEPAPAPANDKKTGRNGKATRWCDRDRQKNTSPRRLRVPSANPNFGRVLSGDDLKKADHSSPDKFLPGLKKWGGSGIIVDMDNRKVLWEKNAGTAVPVASMTKLMTILLVVEEIDRNPRLSLDTEVTVTESAMKAIHPKERTSNPVKILKPGDVYTVRQLLLCTAVISSNEAATQLAEVVSGSVGAFVERMNKRARELGLKSIVFHTPSGLNDWRGNEMLASAASAADMVVLAERLLEYPEVFKMFAEKNAVINGKTVPATNKVRGNGIDGIKTGFTKKAGCCLTFSVLRKNRRVIGCVTGFNSGADRKNFCLRLINWAYGTPNPPVRRSAAPKKAPARATKSGGVKNQKKK